MKNLISIVVIVCLIAITAMVIVEKASTAGATVNDLSAGSFSTSTYYASVSSQAQGGCVLLKGVTDASIGTGRVSGVLENLIVYGGPKGGTIQLFNATSSNINNRFGNQPTTTILLAEFPAGIATSTYQMNVSFGTGLLMCVSGTPSTSTVTWK